MTNAREFQVATNGALAFSIRYGTDRPWWWYLDIHGQPIYLIGNNCGTCNAMFKRVSNADLPLTPRQLSDQLGSGLDTISQDIVDTVTVLLPRGRYRAELLTITPSLVTCQNQPRGLSCNADYFWVCHFEEHEKGYKYEIVLPIVVRSEIDPDRVASYKAKLESGHNPTALALSIRDHRDPMLRYSQSALVHFLLDGHHKVMAASQTSRPISVLSFSLLDSYMQSGRKRKNTPFTKALMQRNFRP